MSQLTPQPSKQNTTPANSTMDGTPNIAPEQGTITRIPEATLTRTKRRLILTREGKILREILITGSNISIGRKHDNDIQLNDITLSGYHAQISSVPDYVFIEDLGSTNGTLVNGNHVKKVALEQGDIIQIGYHQLTYLQESNDSYQPTMFVKAEFDETQFIFESGTVPLPAKGLPLGGFRTLGGFLSKPVMELRKTYNTIGFQGKCATLITRESDGYYISSVISSLNRHASDIPKLNGAAIDTKLTLLKDNDIINIAGVEVQFYFLS